MLVAFLKESINLWLEVSPYLLLGIFIAGVLHVFLGKQFVIKHLGKGGVLSVIKATLLGIPLPVCSCGVIPLASSLRKDGAHKSSVLSFLVSTPITGIDSILATYSLLGPFFAIFRPLAAFISGITLGLLDLFIEGKKEVLLHKEEELLPPKKSFSDKLKDFFIYLFAIMPKDIGKWLMIGILLGAAITVVLPKELFLRYLGFPLDFIAALVIGVPLYVCATGSIPIAASLLYKGFSPGACLVFLVVGPATNMITLAFVKAKLGTKSFILYLINIIAVSWFLGMFLNFIWQYFSSRIELITGMGKMLPYPIKLFSGIILLFLILLSHLIDYKTFITKNFQRNRG